MTGTDVDLILAGVNQYLMKLAEKQVELAFEQAQKERDDLSERTKQSCNISYWLSKLNKN